MSGQAFISGCRGAFFRSRVLGLSSWDVRRSLLGITLGHLAVARSLATTSTRKEASTMLLPIGYDNFREVIENQLDFVDKSLFIEDILADKATKAAVFTRPRRFGKTLNLSMLHHFLAGTVDGQSTAGLFKGLHIAQRADLCAQHQGKYPVVFITFKDIKAASFEDACAGLANLMSRTYTEHVDLLSSEKLFSHQKKVFETILEQRATKADLQSALLNLTQVLHQHHGVKPWLLIDEYDTPIQASYVQGHYDPMIELMRGLFGSALKTNPHLERAVMTGILRVAKESLFSGVNNLQVYSLLRPQYAEYFGFTEPEVAELLKKAQLEERAEAIKQWYNGYQVGSATLYNPWSMASCIREKGELIPYWINTSDNKLIRDLLVKSSAGFKEQFELLLQGKSVEKLIDENIVFGDLQTNESAVWSLLLMTGYLKVVSKRSTEQGVWYSLEIPNQEVRRLYRKIIEEWLANGHGLEWYNAFLGHLLTGDLVEFEREFTQLMEETASVHDMSRDPEAFYQGFMLGLTASLSRSEHYELESNRESGYGRFDYLIFSRDKNKLSVLLEFKRVKAVKDPEKLMANLKKAAAEALVQIDKNHYMAVASQRGCERVLKIGLAFSGKRFVLQHAYAGVEEMLLPGARPDALGS